MSSLMLLSIKEKKDILKNLVSKRSRKFNKEYEKLLETINANNLKTYKKRLQNLKEEFRKELNTININDVNWEVHERKGAEIEKKFNQKLLNIKYEINSLLNSLNELKKIYENYEKSYDELIRILDNEKLKNLTLELKKIELPTISNMNQIHQIKTEITKELEKIEKIKIKAKVVSEYNFSNFKEKKLKLSNELEEALGKVKSLSEKEYKRIKNLDIDENLKLKEAKVIYQRLVYSNIYKEEIETLLEDMPEYLKEKFEKLKQKEIIYKNEYEKLLDEYYNQENEEISVDKIVEAFEEMGYKFENVVLNEKGYINTDKEEYKIAYRIENNKFSLAFTRFIDETTQINEYEKEKDKREAKKWCDNFEKIIKLLEKEGIYLDKEMVKEPEEIEIRYEIIENKKSNQKFEANNLQRQE